jgi:hypothetical protein
MGLGSDEPSDEVPLELRVVLKGILVTIGRRQGVLAEGAAGEGVPLSSCRKTMGKTEIEEFQLAIIDQPPHKLYLNIQ